MPLGGLRHYPTPPQITPAQSALVAPIKLRDQILGVLAALLGRDEANAHFANALDIVHWPVAMDFKYKDVEAMADRWGWQGWTEKFE